MDVLSEVLSTVRLRGAIFFNAEFSAPWCISSSGAAGIEPHLPFPNAHLIMFHFLTEGRAYARLGELRVDLDAGDIVVLPGGDSHLLGNGPLRGEPVDSFREFAASLAQGLRAVKFGGGGEKTKFVCGYMACDPRLADVFLSGLPRLLRVPVAAGPSGKWIENSIRFSVDASTGSNEGSSLVVGKLSEVLFVETLRSYISLLPKEQTGWLAGLRDPNLAKALALMHRDPARDWTVEALAKDVGLSRTRLAERFRHFLGMSPIAYLTDWRMRIAADALEKTDKSVVEVAMDVGYNSEAAFNRAFKRAYNAPPAQFRQQKKGLRVVELSPEPAMA
ncbi:AraC family transcriptional regulator [Occallatibacter savannae]|uniref:AraC family transcriptional regulator n=1 Tax=Occallatibacter savannae TaxID=1002691 RepID=UPI000D690A22|nr:AraC family transcriptional regulator [Occallatibacter savannae]